jgi:hypothetical protein
MAQPNISKCETIELQASLFSLSGFFLGNVKKQIN